MADSVSLLPNSPHPECFRPLQRVREGYDREVFFGGGGAQQPGHLAASPDQKRIPRRPSLYLGWIAAVLGTDYWFDTGDYRFLLPKPIRQHDEDAEQDRTDSLTPYYSLRNYRVASVTSRVTIAMRPNAEQNHRSESGAGSPA